MARIGIITHNYPSSSSDRQNAGTFVHDFARELSKEHQVFVLGPADFGFKGKLGSWSIFNPLSIIKFFILMRKGRQATLEFMQKNRIQFAIAMWALPGGVWAFTAKDKLKVPYAVFSLGSDINKYASYPILGQLITSSLKQADFRFGVSSELVRKTKQLSGKKTVYLPIATNFSVKKPAKIKLSNVFNFLFVGNLEKVKGVDILLESCQILAQKGKKFHLYILGQGSLEDFLKQKIEEYNLDNQVTLFGVANINQVSGFMQAADCLVIPSRSEGMSLVMVEAAYSGLPIITNKVGDCASYVKKYQVGLVSEAINAKAFSDVMAKAIKIGKDFKSNYQQQTRQMSSDISLGQTVPKFLAEVSL